MKRFVDLSTSIESGLPVDPPAQIPAINYISHKLCSIFGSSTPSLTTANRCNSRSSIFSGRWQSLAVAGVCNTFATLNKGLKINFQKGKENSRHGSKRPMAGVVLPGPLLQ